MSLIQHLVAISDDKITGNFKIAVVLERYEHCLRIHGFTLKPYSKGLLCANFSLCSLLLCSRQARLKPLRFLSSVQAPPAHPIANSPLRPTRLVRHVLISVTTLTR